ncbi:hypothetical protein C0992_004708 [Termitomyces sp. T32_za158]|nr:hypothetical protein C0992_004708 [Termitomyces sp. T32_za158]
MVSLKAPAIHDGIPHLTPLLRTPDGADLACFLLPQTEASLKAYESNKNKRALQSHNPRTKSRERRKRKKQKRPPIQNLEKKGDNAHASASVEIPAAAASARATVLMFFGNAVQNWEEIPVAKEFHAFGCNVLLVSYRGYAFSTGKPSERGLQIDAQTALDYVLSQPHLAHTPLALRTHRAVLADMGLGEEDVRRAEGDEGAANWRREGPHRPA